ncbi:hypothetical protein TSAR_016051 [Trichomalopsis sarcophagae]|uniref:Uncharacterized protein n=1 Tax=Trichomalopsis sarcophagae TaxID=543379 RepID=A0A232EGV4_9HYME|nr:hypothetical protein TSAR_016051 [Trichomalopsis sarcophagae]
MASFENSLIDQVCDMTDAQYDPEELDAILYELQSRTATEPATATITTSDMPAYFDPDMIRCEEEVQTSPSNNASEVTDSESSAFGNDPTSALLSNVWAEHIADNLLQEFCEVPAESEPMDVSSPAKECQFLEPFKKLELVQILQRTINRSVACINTGGEGENQ